VLPKDIEFAKTFNGLSETFQDCPDVGQLHTEQVVRDALIALKKDQWGNIIPFTSSHSSNDAEDPDMLVRII